MANTVSNNRISNLVQSQLPAFARDDHPMFATFLEYYYKYLEQDQKTVNTIKVLDTYQDVDLTIDQFSDKMYSLFMKFLPKDAVVDKNLLIKNIKDFYRAKGTENATRFLMRILYNIEIEFYYPKKDVIRASDGKWFVQKSVRITETAIENVANNNISGLEKFVGTRITGNTSNASALVERVDRFFEQGTQIDELIISNVDGDFENGETIFAIFNDTEDTDTITANIFGGIVSSVIVLTPGTGYQVGDPVILVSNTGTGACATVSAVTTGNISSLTILSGGGGAGYQVGNQILFSGGGGTGANANVSSVNKDESIHPNSYNIVYSTINLEANTLLNNAVYSNLNSSNVNFTIANAVNTFVYANTGPINGTLVYSPGQNYTSDPTASVVANSMIFGLGVLGRMSIANAGSGYVIGDTIEFINVPGGYGFGAHANVTNVDGSGGITQVNFQQLYGHLIGGAGYDMSYLPTANVVSGTGTGANVIVTAILGAGANLDPITSSVGGIQRITIYNRGSNYLSNTTVDLTGSGDGTATANAVVVAGTFSYPGRYLNDDGHLSSYNFIQDRDYYQTYAYVIRSTKSIANYRQALKEIVHPSGMKLWGEWLYINENVEANVNTYIASVSGANLVYSKTYTKNVNTINVSYTSHGFVQNANVRLEFTSGNYANVRNGIYQIANAQSNFFTVIQKSNIQSISITNAGRNYNSNSHLVIVGDGVGANAYYNTNSVGSITSVSFRDHGIRYTYSPTITANGTNSVSAVFSSVLSYQGNTSGNVFVSAF